MLLILFGVTGVDGGLFSHTSASVSVHDKRGGGYGSWGEEISISLRDGGSYDGGGPSGFSSL
jgi:hypothetical protein